MAFHNPSHNLSAPPLRETLVSVVVPTYNRAQRLAVALRSALAQSWRDLEIVIVDDGSTDETRDVVAALANQDERIRYFYQPNGGVSAARNQALSHCRGAMIAFLDSDDTWHPWKLGAQVGILQALPHVGMTWSDMNAVDDDGRVTCTGYLRRMYKGYGRLASQSLFRSSARFRELTPGASAPNPDALVSWGNIYSPMLFGNLVHTSTVLLSRERASQVGCFDPAMRAGGEDYKFHLATTRFGDVAFLDSTTIDYRVGGDDQITTDRRNQPSFAAAFLATIEEEIQGHRSEIKLSDRELSAIRAEAHDWLASAMMESGRIRHAASHALQAIGQRPLTPRAWKTLVKSILPKTLVRLWRAARRVPNGAIPATT
jgi:hypothetical protein